MGCKFLYTCTSLVFKRKPKGQAMKISEIKDLDLDLERAVSIAIDKAIDSAIDRMDMDNRVRGRTIAISIERAIDRAIAVEIDADRAIGRTTGRGRARAGAIARARASGSFNSEDHENGIGGVHGTGDGSGYRPGIDCNEDEVAGVGNIDYAISWAGLVPDKKKTAESNYLDTSHCGVDAGHGGAISNEHGSNAEHCGVDAGHGGAIPNEHGSNADDLEREKIRDKAYLKNVHQCLSSINAEHIERSEEFHKKCLNVAFGEKTQEEIIAEYEAGRPVKISVPLEEIISTVNRGVSLEPRKSWEVENLEKEKRRLKTRLKIFGLVVVVFSILIQPVMYHLDPWHVRSNAQSTKHKA